MSPRGVLALDVGGTKLAAGVVAADGTVVSFRQLPTEVHQGPDKVVERLVELGRRVLADAGGAVTSVGIGCGGPFNPATGTILGPPGLPGWDAVPLRSMVAGAFGLPAVLENDGTAAALGEYRWGGWGVGNLVYLTVSTGLGGGVVLDGRLRRGAAGQGGELGHVVVDWQGRQCGCGQRGCAEAYVSGTAIAARAAEAVEAARQAAQRPTAERRAAERQTGAQPTGGRRTGDRPPGRAGGVSSLSTLDRISARDVAVAARAGDALARRVWDDSTAMLGRVIAVLVNVFEPELVVLGGGVTRAGDMLIEPVRRTALARAMPPAAAAARVELSRHGPHVGVLGAAAVAFGAASPPTPSTVEHEAKGNR
jgi:glucokinase